MNSRGFVVLAPTLVVSLLLAGCSTLLGKPVREDGAITQSGEAVVSDLQVGDCFNAVGPRDEYGGELSTIPLVPCSEPHDFEAYFAFDLDDNDGFYPGDTAVDTAADDGCYEQFEVFIGTAFEDSELSYNYLTPTAAGWVDAGNRQILCVVLGDGQVEGSLRDSAR